MTPRKPEHEKKIGFWVHVQRSDGGWMWTGGARGKYGQSSRLGKSLSAHRHSWILHYGPIPDGLFVLHKCDVPRCVRPDHLFLGTHQKNMDDMYAKGRGPTGDRNGSRTHPDRRQRGADNPFSKHPEYIPRGDDHWTRRHPERLRGANNPHCKLTDDQIASLRAERAKGRLQKDIAREFGITQTHVSRVLRGLAR